MVYYKSKYRENSILEKLQKIDWILILLALLICTFSIFMLYSAGTHSCEDNVCQYGAFSPWANKQLMRFCIGFLALLFATLIPIKFILKISMPLYILSIITLIYVQFFGHVGMGAQRWISLGGFKLQPSELVKIAIVLVLAKYFASLKLGDIKRNKKLIIPALLTAIPFVLVLKQPDLGTALILAMISGGIMFISGVQVKKFLIVLGLIICAIPIIWMGMHDYQRNRVKIFLHPELDSSGAGYHITQAKIAMGSGGFIGQGWLKGSQSHLNFLPEKQTDFIFTMISEELGMLGGMTLLILYMLMLQRCFKISLNARSPVLKIVSFGLSFNIFCYVFINTAMIMGLIPVVGVPLALVSYGGTSSVTVLATLGIIQNININKDKVLSTKDY